MANIDWPSYGKMMTGQITEVAVPNILRTEMESGYAKQAKKTGKQLRNIEITVLFTAAEYATWKTWFYDTAAAGASFFNATDPIEGTTKEFRIVGGAYTATPLTPRANYFNVTMTWERYA